MPRPSSQTLQEAATLIMGGSAVLAALFAISAVHDRQEPPARPLEMRRSPENEPYHQIPPQKGEHSLLVPHAR